MIGSELYRGKHCASAASLQTEFPHSTSGDVGVIWWGRVSNLVGLVF